MAEGRKEMFYLTTHSTHFIYGYMESDIWLRTILIVRKETRCHHIGYSFRLTARVLLYSPSHRIAHTTAYVTPVVEHWLEREIAQWVHPMKDRSDDPSHHERTVLPRSYISLQVWQKCMFYLTVIQCIVGFKACNISSLIKIYSTTFRFCNSSNLLITNLLLIFSYSKVFIILKIKDKFLAIGLRFRS